MHKFIYITLILFHFQAKAQLGKEAWHWNFGAGCGLDFSSGVPVVSTSSLNSFNQEGSASISESNGHLLFYTDGVSVWDKTNSVMPNGNGLLGSFTSTQSALIVPKPGSSTIYYLISADQGGYGGTNQGIHYSIVDITLNGGLGDVTIKNQLLTPPPTTEKLVGVKHCNGTDYWIITHPFNSNTFNAYLVNSVGINLVPTVSHSGTIEQSSSSTNKETIGYLKASPNGKKLALATSFYTTVLEIFDFDNSNGQVSNAITINYNMVDSYGNLIGPYGVSFSPDNSKLYSSLSIEYSPNNAAFLYQYDLSSGIASTIIASKKTIGTSNNYFGAIQIGVDGKIYVTTVGNSLGVINNPNNLGTSCNFQNYAVALPYNSEFGLPNFIDSYSTSTFNSFTSTKCGQVFPLDTLDAGIGNNNFNWSTGVTTETIAVSTPGKYWVSYDNTIGCKETDTFQVIQKLPPVINVLRDTSECGNSFSPLSINASYPNTVLYNWSNGLTGQVNSITTPGTYWIDFTLNNSCISRDSFTLYLNPNPVVNLGNDTTFCLGYLPLNAFNLNSTYLWNTGETSPTIIATHATTFWVKVNQQGCISSDTLIVNPAYSLLNLSLPNIVTPNNDNINDEIDFSKYQFTSLQLEIFNRWGQKVFETNDVGAIWKPTLEDGTYFFTSQYQINCGATSEMKNLRGFITVVR